MDTSIFTIEAAVLMVAASIALIVWFQGSETALSIGRMTRMMTRFGLDSGIAGRADPQLMKQSRARCAKCPREDQCERWLAGETGGDNSFCPNATIFGNFE